MGWSKRHHLEHRYLLPLMAEGTLIMLFGLYGTVLPQTMQVPALGILLLCFLMGLQNATITSVSGARIRTTHLTGICTDIGIQLVRFWHRWKYPAAGLKEPDPTHFHLLLSLILCFFCGGLIGALGFQTMGLGFAFPLGAILLALGLPVALHKRQ
jgi:uncharacterized membrane protein YoaK (UPF0700 family)